MRFLDQLFGLQTWCGNDRDHFEGAFCNTYVNFTHWIITKDSFPAAPNRQLLPNLWARDAALQCSLNQESLDLLIPTYAGPVDDDSNFDPAMFSSIVAQVTYKSTGDVMAGQTLRPIGIPRDPYDPLPFVALLLELGNESSYQKSKSKILAIASEPGDVDFQTLKNNFSTAVETLQQYRHQKKLERRKVKMTRVKRLREELVKTRTKMDGYNRYSIFVRGASPEAYGILNKANIVVEFATLLRMTVPAPADLDSNIQQMRPLERLGDSCAHTAWMLQYTVGGMGDDEADFDRQNGLK